MTPFEIEAIVAPVRAIAKRALELCDEFSADNKRLRLDNEALRRLLAQCKSEMGVTRVLRNPDDTDPEDTLRRAGL